ncbi:glycosyltransferase family 2 protein [Candidatus Kirkpatrickella diaphorinae]|uniref:Glycosyltransferase family 2 protein n=1 Tax=Candidatus Kirkpatrickella diaphorinae TaxID=2984322 RepID=A0ABY6GGL3_9PROT|nr:glycosyltransferase family 2 protein [Candidatus Kirkpatrickella diaphorinae]UYH50636.1 glycosyltransferase family 2 protein [Candidatus Kirkpatrickella diaphorinae]
MTSDQENGFMPPPHIDLRSLKTEAGTYVFICPETDELGHVDPSEPQYRATALITFPEIEGFGILSRVKLLRRPPGQAMLRNTLRHNFLPVRLEGAGAEDQVFLKHALSGDFFIPILDGETELLSRRRYMAEAHAPLRWENFQGALPEDFREMVARWRDLAAARHNAAAFLDVLAGFPQDFMHDCLDIALLMIADDARATFLSFFLFDEAHLSSPQQATCLALLDRLPSAGWLKQAISSLAQWQADRDLPMPRRSDAAYDFMGRETSWRDNARDTVGVALLSALRENITPRHKLAALTSARDEGVYLLEWIAFHRTIGVEKIFIYTNNLTDGSDVLLQRLHDAGIVHWVDNTGEGCAGVDNQLKAFAHAYTMMPALLDYEWCLTVDLDEWFVPSEAFGHKLPPLLAQEALQDADAVVATWRVNGPDHRLHWTEQLSCERFVALEPHPLVKSVHRPRRFQRCSHHVPVAPQRRCFKTVDGAPHAINTHSVYETSFYHQPTVKAEVHHFILRSFEEFVWRYARGENDGNAVLPVKRFRYNNHGIFELFLTRFRLSGSHLSPVIAARCHEEINGLMAIPGVRDAYQDVVRHFGQTVSLYVEQSLEAVRQDGNVSAEIRAEWTQLVEAWQKADAPVACVQ